MMLARRRARAQVARLYREWCRACVMRTNRRHGKALARSEAQLEAAAQEVDVGVAVERAELDLLGLRLVGSAQPGAADGHDGA